MTRWAAIAALFLFLVIDSATGAEERHRGEAAVRQPIRTLPVTNIDIDVGKSIGRFEPWRHTLGHGGINSHPLPPNVVESVAKLRPRLIRIFIQEFFFIYPEHGKFDWTRLDPYMDALAKTGAKMVAAITIKPRPIFPKIDASIWRPENVEEWRKVVFQLARRYSVEKPIITHWEIGNETDIGESGGCPYLIPDAKDYAEHYRMTIQPILEAFPKAKVGGAAVANANGELLPKFIELCKKEKIQLDFVSWHLYADDPRAPSGLVEKYKKILADYPGQRPEMMVTEWSKGFDPISVEELAYEPRRAAQTAAAIMAMTDAGVDWSFYYHIWDQVAYADDFKQFFRNPGIMYTHWNEIPHRFGLFGVGGEVRPQYFVYQMLQRMGEERIAARSEDADLRTLASRAAGTVWLMVANFNTRSAEDKIARLRFSSLESGRNILRTYRIDRAGGWSGERMDLKVLESREVDVGRQFSCQVYCPSDSVILVELVRQ